jgi:hypothetical protein
MTAFAINSGVVVDWDSLSGGSVNATLDTYTISNGSTLRIQCDSYHCAGHSAAAGSLDTVSGANIGGTVEITSVGVEHVAYTGGTGNVPAIGTTISQGGVSGYLLGVWQDWQSEPTAPGAAMPSAGYIKFKARAGGSFAAGALTNIGATASGAEAQSWIEVRGADTANFTTSAQLVFKTRGGFLELGTTNGSRGQTLPCPTSATVAGTLPGCWIETAPGSGVKEWYSSAGTLVSSATPTDATRGKLVWFTTSGLVIGSDGTNNVGYLPASGCRVWVPSTFLTCCTRTGGSGSGPRVLPNATQATRFEFAIANARFDIEYASVQWFINGANQSIQSWRAVHCGFASGLIISWSGLVTMDDAHVGPVQAQDWTPLNISLLTAGSFTDCKFVCRTTTAGTSSALITNNVRALEFEGCHFQSLTNAVTPDQDLLVSLLTTLDSTFTGCTLVGGSCQLNLCDTVTWEDTTEAFWFTGTTQTTPTEQWAFRVSNSNRIRIDGIELPVTNAHPYDALVCVIGSSSELEVRNFGDIPGRAPLDLGSSNACAQAILFNSNATGKDFAFKRIYTQNARTRWFTAAADQPARVLIENCPGDYADTGQMTPAGMIVMGGGYTPESVLRNTLYGSHFQAVFTAATTGQIIITGNPPSTLTAAQAVASGTALFNVAGSVLLPAINDRVVWEMPRFALGYTATANIAPTITGTNTGNFTVEFQYDVGSGWNGSWATLNQTNWNAVGAINPAIGIKLMVRATCTTANTGNLISRVAVNLVTTTNDQLDNLYPLDTVTVAVNGLAIGSRVKVIRNDTDAIIYTGVESSGVVSFTTDYTGDITVEARCASSPPFYKPWTTVGTVGEGIAFTATQILDS